MSAGILQNWEVGRRSVYTPALKISLKLVHPCLGMGDADAVDKTDVIFMNPGICFVPREFSRQ